LCFSFNERTLSDNTLILKRSQFYQHIVHLFCMKVICSAFLHFKFGFILFWFKKIGTKTNLKIWVNLTPRFYLQKKTVRINKLLLFSNIFFQITDSIYSWGVTNMKFDQTSQSYLATNQGQGSRNFSRKICILQSSTFLDFQN